jgi:predicted glycosyltransferase
MSARVFIWVQHLLGFGHFARARAVSEALRDAGFAVTLASGGVTPAEAIPSGIAFIQLPAARAKDELFEALVDADGNDVDQAWLERRRDVLLDALRSARPDAVITETFPFGRRLLKFELQALLNEVAQMSPRPKLIASVRDVLHRPRKAGRAEASVATARAHYDAIMVHGDPNIIRLEESFAELAALTDRFVYAGYICVEMPKPSGARQEVLVSAGGGVTGRALMATALQARALSRLKHRPWTLVAGPLTDDLPGETPGVTVVRSLPDFRARLAGAAVSISQAGYNTMIEAVKARTPSVVVPYETEREKEQAMRAGRFAELGLVKVLRAEALDPHLFARAIDEAEGTTPPSFTIDFNGRAGAVRAVRQILGL